MQKFILSTASAALAAVGVLSALAAAPVSAAQIYPVDQARFMTNAKFDFKIELDKKADRKNVVVEINGADYKKVLKGSEIWVPEEIDSEERDHSARRRSFRRTPHCSPHSLQGRKEWHVSGTACHGQYAAHGAPRHEFG